MGEQILRRKGLEREGHQARRPSCRVTMMTRVKHEESKEVKLEGNTIKQATTLFQQVETKIES